MAGRELETTDGKARAQEMGTQQRAGAARDGGRHGRHLSGARRARSQQRVLRPQSSGGLSDWARGRGTATWEEGEGQGRRTKGSGAEAGAERARVWGSRPMPLWSRYRVARSSSLARGAATPLSRRPALGWGRPRAPPHQSSAPPHPGPRCPGCPGRGCRPLCCSRSRRPCRPGSAGACGW